jgi:glycosyltransferase involved in cell wall biosynthesis
VVWDRTKKERKRKLDVFSNTPLNIHVTTNWMREKVAARTVGWNARIFQFPFGIDTSTFQPGGRNLARDFFGIEDDVFVVTARATDDERKGFVELVRALDDVVASGRRVLLLTLQQQGLVSKHSTNVESLELPWTNDLNHLAMFYQAADVFVMPSSAETFGMMALEAMACGTPVITVAGTATSEVVACNPLEVSSQLLTESLRKKLAWTIDNSEKLLVFGAESRKRALESFSLDSYLENLRTMYSKVLDGT